MAAPTGPRTVALPSRWPSCPRTCPDLWHSASLWSCHWFDPSSTSARCSRRWTRCFSRLRPLRRCFWCHSRSPGRALCQSGTTASPYAASTSRARRFRPRGSLPARSSPAAQQAPREAPGSARTKTRAQQEGRQVQRGPHHAQPEARRMQRLQREARQQVRRRPPRARVARSGARSGPSSRSSSSAWRSRPRRRPPPWRRPSTAAARRRRARCCCC